MGRRPIIDLKNTALSLGIDREQLSAWPDNLHAVGDIQLLGVGEANCLANEERTEVDSNGSHRRGGRVRQLERFAQAQFVAVDDLIGGSSNHQSRFHRADVDKSLRAIYYIGLINPAEDTALVRRLLQNIHSAIY